MYKLLLVDDEDIIREGIRDLIPWDSISVEVVAEAIHGQDALQKIEELHPDIVLTDIVMPIMDGIELTRTIYRQYPDTKVIIISAYQEIDYFKAAFANDVVDYVMKPYESEELLSVTNRAIAQLEEKRRLIDEMKAIKRQMDEDNAHARHFFMRNLLFSDQRSSIAYDQEFRRFSLPFAGDDAFAAMIVDCGCQDENTADSESALVRSIEAVFEGCRVSVVNMDDKEWAVLLGSSEAEDICRYLSPEAMQELQQRLCSVMGSAVILGVGCAVQGAAGIHTTVLQAMDALSRQVIYMDESVYMYAQMQKNLDEEIPLEVLDIKNEFVEKLDFNDAGTAHGQAELFMDRIKQVHVFRIHLFHSICYSTLMEILKKAVPLLDGSKARQFGNEFAALYQIRSFQQSASFFTGQVDAIAAAIADQTHLTNERLVMLVDNILQSGYMDPLTMEDIAARVYRSPNYMASLYKQHTGTTINHRLTDIRMKKSKELLRNDKLKIYEVAEMVGYTDSNYFAKIFRKKTGLTPLEYRKKI